MTDVEIKAGNGAVPSKSSFTLDESGNLETVDGPLSRTADTTKFYYDVLRRQTGVVGAHPDGGGSLKHRAVKTKLDAVHGYPVTVEIGTAPSNTAVTLLLTTLQKTETFYDAYDRPIKTVVYGGAGSNILYVTQTNYDAAGRVECTALRMNPSEFAAADLPASACTLETTVGDFGNAASPRPFTTKPGK